jgi:hypothetical protein
MDDQESQFTVDVLTLSHGYFPGFFLRFVPDML